jgi:SAM-dependent methyltransferase
VANPQDALDAAIQAYYGSDDEHARLTSGSAGGGVELARTAALVDALLAPGSRVLDVGGATGVHAARLAAEGHVVTLVDPVPAQVAAAAAVGTFVAVVGDARALPAPDASVDAVLLLGPLYHLVAREDRMLALSEARRVLRPGGLLAAQGIGRLAAFSDSVRRGGFEALGDEDLRILRTGEWVNPGEGFPGGHFHTAAELRAEVTGAGFVDVVLHGLEGPNVGSLELVARDAELEALAGELATRAEALVRPGLQDQLAEASPHLLALARR